MGFLKNFFFFKTTSLFGYDTPSFQRNFREPPKSDTTDISRAVDAPLEALSIFPP